ncbi:MAG TPA: NAD(P)-binding domain-containing protein [Candidatus Nanopelagicales bacterium]|nr:NAD(P)-binding domain-containing protein [Candidatus Nanopelagicales bacterium]
MTTISIIGKGNMGGAIASIATAAGITPQVVDQGQDDVAVTGDIVVLAVPYGALEHIVAARGQQLAGKIVVDITNPVNFETFDSLVVPAHSSAAAELAEALPQSSVVKAFNTNFAGTLAAGTLGDLATTVLIAGDDADAKKTLADVVAAGGLKAVDAGPLARARELEAVGFLQITLAAAEKVSWVGGFGIVA